MKKSLSFLVLCMFFLCSAITVHAKTYIYGTEFNAPPFVFQDADGKFTGFAIGDMEAIAKLKGFEVKHKVLPWEELLPALLEKKIDIICCGLSITPERAKIVNFTDSYMTVEKLILVGKNSKMTAEEALKRPIKIGVQRGTTDQNILEQRKLKENLPFSLSLFDSYPLAVEALLNGNVEAVALDSILARQFIQKGTAVKKAGCFAEGESIAMAVRKEDTELLKLLNEGEKELQRSPQHKKSVEKYFIGTYDLKK